MRLRLTILFLFLVLFSSHLSATDRAAYQATEHKKKLQSEQQKLSQTKKVVKKITTHTVQKNSTLVTSPAKKSTVFSQVTVANITHLLSTKSNFGEKPAVKIFIDHMVKKHQFERVALTKLMNQVKFHPKVISHIKKPLEKESWHTYQRLFVNPWRIQHGVEFWNRHEATLKRAEKEFGVPAAIIVATLGVETKYGQRMGDYRVIDSLSSIAFSDSPRAKFFRSELEAFLILTRSEKLDPLAIKGSYAGAIGQPQFMPSSFLSSAINFSNSGKIDLMHNEIDVIGSIANYYKQRGWMPDAPIAAEAITINNHYQNLFAKNNKISFSVAEWALHGILTKYKLNSNKIKAKLIILESPKDNGYWLGFHNFDVIKRYNSSNLYAMAVYELSLHITTQRERWNHG